MARPTKRLFIAVSFPVSGGRSVVEKLVAGARLHLLLELFLQPLQVEARALLHGRELDEGLGVLPDLLLHEDEAPELVHEPVVVGDRSADPRALEGIETEIDENGPVDLDRAAQPAVGLIDEPVLVVVDTYGAQRRLGEVEDLVPLRLAGAREHVHLVVAVEIDLVAPVAKLLALLELGRDVRIPG